jgi:hypothetical protein
MRITSSSISSSDPAGSDLAGTWRRFSLVFALSAAAALAGLVGLAYAVDPYDSGRSRLFAKAGVRPQGPRTAGASRGRDPAFDAAIIGNSHIQLLSPERLKEKTGLPFVQLSVPGTGPKEQLVILDWFLRHRERPARSVVLGIDESWCTADPDLANQKPFPFWLYSESPLDYARGLVRSDILEELPRRLAYVFGAPGERARPDGYWDYEAENLGPGSDPALWERRGGRPGDGAGNLTGRFPAAMALAARLLPFPAGLAFVLVFPPTYIAAQPKPGTPRHAADEACKARFRELAAARPRTAVVDWRTDRPANRDPALFLDETHYRQPIARAVENEVAAALRTLR